MIGLNAIREDWSFFFFFLCFELFDRTKKEASTCVWGINKACFFLYWLLKNCGYGGFYSQVSRTHQNPLPLPPLQSLRFQLDVGIHMEEIMLLHDELVP
jgi:hypothetical protein